MVCELTVGAGNFFISTFELSNSLLSIYYCIVFDFYGKRFASSSDRHIRIWSMGKYKLYLSSLTEIVCVSNKKMWIHRQKRQVGS